MCTQRLKLWHIIIKDFQAHKITASNESSNSTNVIKCPHIENDFRCTHNGIQFNVSESIFNITHIGLSVFSNQPLFQLTQDKKKGVFKAFNRAKCIGMII